LGKMLGMGKSKTKVEEADFPEKLYKGAYLVQTDRPNLRIRNVSDIQIIAAALRT